MKPYKRETTRNKNFKKFDKGKPKPKPLSFEQMFKKFKKKVERDGTLQEVRKREFYEKPAQKKQRKKKEAIRKEKLRHEADGLPSRRYF